MSNQTPQSPSAPTCHRWLLRTREIEFSKGPALMGIVNVTPDSFSDGGKFFTPSQAVEHALRLEDAGADILDIGGESTRPYSEPVSADEELRRVVPVIESLMARVALPLSIDTSKGRVAAAALQLGAEIVNDVTGLTGDESMLELVANSGAGVCVMHMQGTPQTMQESPSYGDVTSDIYSYLSQRDAALRDAGILPERICLDPGIGFGKTHEQNIQLVRECSHFLHLGRPILIGHSRKGFIGRLLGDSQLDRTAGSVAISLALAQRRIQVLRIHDVKETSQALACFAAVGGLLTGD